MLWPTMLNLASGTLTLREGVESFSATRRGFHDVPPPVVGEDVMAQAGVAEQIRQVGVLREPEDAREDVVGPEEPARKEIVLAGAQGKGRGQSQVVVAQGVARVQPDLRAVGAEELASQEPRDHHGRRHIGVVAVAFQQARVERPPGCEGAGQHQRGAACEDSREEGEPGSSRVVLRAVGHVLILRWAPRHGRGPRRSRAHVHRSPASSLGRTDRRSRNRRRTRPLGYPS